MFPHVKKSHTTSRGLCPTRQIHAQIPGYKGSFGRAYIERKTMYVLNQSNMDSMKVFTQENDEQANVMRYVVLGTAGT